MRTTVLTWAAALVAALIVAPAPAEEPKRPERPNPEAFWAQLDKNRDGAFQLEELPPRMRQTPGLVEKLDKNGDKRIDRREFGEVLRHLAQQRRAPGAEGRRPGPGRHGPMAHGPRRQGPPAFAARPGERRGRYDRPSDWDRVPYDGRRGDFGPWRARPQVDFHGRAWQGRGHFASYAGRGPWGPGPSFRRPYGPPPWDAWRSHRRPPQFDGERRPFGPPAARSAMRMPDPKEVFKRLDRNGDGQLSLEEFTAGMKRFHQAMAERLRPGPGARESGQPGRRPEARGERTPREREMARGEAERHHHARPDMGRHRGAKPEKPEKPEKPAKPEKPSPKPEAKEKI